MGGQRAILSPRCGTVKGRLLHIWLDEACLLRNGKVVVGSSLLYHYCGRPRPQGEDFHGQDPYLQCPLPDTLHRGWDLGRSQV